MAGSGVVIDFDKTPSPKQPRIDVGSRRKNENEKLDRLVDEFTSEMQGGAGANSSAGPWRS
eukprot:6853966-Pyramimonas_sp.AAC.1